MKQINTNTHSFIDSFRKTDSYLFFYCTINIDLPKGPHAGLRFYRLVTGELKNKINETLWNK